MFEIYKISNSVLISNEEINKKLALLPQFLQNKISNYANTKKKQQRIEGLALLTTALKNNKMDENFINSIYYNVYGKPFISTEIDFSISYSHTTTVLGFIKNGVIGVDVEQIRIIEGTVYKDYFTNKEWEFMNQKGFSEVTFFKLWTRKEAVVKAIGKGAFIDFNLIEVIEDSIIIEDKILYLTTRFEEGFCWSIARS